VTARIASPVEAPVRVVEGRRVVDELPGRIGVSEAEIELAAQHLFAIVADLFGDAEEEVGE
jgi:hypothetical protein